MIQANDLRVGNLLLLDTGFTLPQWHRIVPKDIFDIAEGKITLASIEPIKLTNIVIGRCKPNLFDWFIEGSYILVPDKEYGYCLKCRNASHTKELEFGYFKYLHQLQNIYYILSQGVELEVE
jgi:hypothetical protein